MKKRTIAAAVIVLILMPLTILAGVFLLDDRKYYFISLLLIILAMVPFALVFEKRRPRARELVVVAVLTAIAVVGRAAFIFLPQVKPVLALVIIAGAAMGAESGFAVGALTGFISNFFFGQGPWTPWQMFAMGIIGFLAGLLFCSGPLPKKRLPLCIFGALATVIIYGGIINPSSVLIFYGSLTAERVLAAYATGISFDLIHALSTVVFLFLLAPAFLEKLDRVRLKYGMLN